MNQPLIETNVTDAAAAFRRMAERIIHNESSTFGGACVIIPPTGGGEPVELMLLDASGGAAQFWGVISSRIKMVLEELEAQQRNLQTFGRGR